MSAFQAMLGFDYVRLSVENIEDIRSGLKLKASGFNSEGNFTFIFNTVDYFPELAGITPKDRVEKIGWMASYYLFHLVKGHCFNDGNKRTGVIAAGIFLMKNGFELDYDMTIAVKKIKILDEVIESGKSLLEALYEAFGRDTSSNEYRLTAMIFGLSGAHGLTNYDSPVELYPVLRMIIRPRKESIKKD